ncbi:ice-binding family protein [Methylobacter sp. S3L5C]|uniref:ice-binding family protein n=1 Tax=Methylobacter sp. S3L5C TaxID=2839024 RepID=UPI001FABA6DB|nr:ice-binding family protein [Methylobacter sp. S3L5C]UOA07675.1 DUF3494 domain-containing protein [Methylobacter sp. S3L5C]
MINYKKYSKTLFLRVLLGTLMAGNAIAESVLAPVYLGSVDTFAILSQSGITDVYRSAIVGDIGVSPIAGAALLLVCKEVTGNIYSVDAEGTLTCATTNAVLLTSEAVREWRLYDGFSFIKIMAYEIT